jgi:hypothetical protein
MFFIFLHETLLDAFARLGPERLWRETVFMFLMPMRCGTEKPDLLAIAPTPFAEEQMNPQSDLLAESERLVLRE